MTSETRKQAWLAQFELHSWEIGSLAGGSFWTFRSRSTGRLVRLYLEDRALTACSNRSKTQTGVRKPDLKGISSLLLTLVPPRLYAQAVAVELTRNHTPQRDNP